MIDCELLSLTAMPPPPLVTVGNPKADASAFLARATFGPTIEEINLLAAQRDYNGWIEEQFALPPTSHLDWMTARLPGIAMGEENSDLFHTVKKDAWWDIVVKGRDQLRQRVAFALSEIFVVSQYGPLINEPDGLAAYYDILVNECFLNFRQLLEDVTLSPAMGKYLSFLGNAKADPARGNHPDENYAWEIMQLFTIGLYQLNQDGSIRRDPDTGKQMPTYTQNDVKELARVFTGWSDADGRFLVEEADSSFHSRTTPMTPWDNYHDNGSKHILGTPFPAGRTTSQELDAALDLLFYHPNVGPFIGRRLIQRLVTSNPSPAYIARVAAAFANNGHGVRGDMKAVIKAVLLDPEALGGTGSNPRTFGKVREPLLVISNLWRAFHAENDVHRRGEHNEFSYRCFNFEYARSFLQQNSPQESLTVFNYFTPDDAPPDLGAMGLVAPEMTVLGIDGLHHIIMSFALETYTYSVHEITAHLNVNTETVLLENNQYDALLNRLDILLLAGKMVPEMRRILLDYIRNNKTTTASMDELAREVIALIMTLAEYAVQR